MEMEPDIITPPVSTMATMSPSLPPCTMQYDLTNDNGFLGDDTASMKLLGIHIEESKAVDEGFAFDWLPHFSMGSQNGFDVDHIQTNFTFESPPSSLTSSHMPQLSTDGMAIETNASPLAGDQRLMALVAEIQQQLWNLEQLPWNTESSQGSLDTYPIGNIMDLSRQFHDVVESTFDSASQSPGGTSHHAGNPSSPATPTVLLIMCGYIWLMRLYNVVLDDFKRHLNEIPDGKIADTVGGIANRPIATDGGCGMNTPSGPSALRWGDLTSIDAAIGLHQMSNAVRIMLGMLQNIESKLGSGAAAARDMAMIMLINLGRMQESSADGFSKKAMTVKNLLRERIGL